MKSSKLILLVLILIFYLSGCSSQENSNQLNNSSKDKLVNENNINSKQTEQKTEDIQTPDSLSFETVMTGKIPTSNFSVDSVHKYFQLKIINKSKLLITFNIMNNNNGKVVVVKKLEPHKTLIWNSTIDYPNGLDTGKYTIQYRSNGDNMNGIAYGQLSSTPKE